MPRKPKIGPPSLTEKVGKHKSTKLSINMATAGEKELKKLRKYFDQEKKLLQETFEYLRQSYIETNNPLFIWDARAVARNWNVAAPKWVEDYFDRVGKRLLDAEDIKDIPICLEANGVWGKQTIFEHYKGKCAKDTAVDIIEKRYKDAEKEWLKLKKQYRYKEQRGPEPKLKEIARNVVDEANKHWRLKKSLNVNTVLKYRDERAKRLKTK